jgi:hypothetical protein
MLKYILLACGELVICLFCVSRSWWHRDTVSSIGIVRGKPLPLTWTAEHICIFRHALALDERRVKFLPEYVAGDRSILPLEEASGLSAMEVTPVTAQGGRFEGAGMQSDM